MSVIIPAHRIPLDETMTTAGDFQYQDMGYQPTDNPLQEMIKNRRGTDFGYARLAFYCLNKKRLCSDGCGIIIGNIVKPDFESSWAWNGNLDKPTLTPSINCTRCWHGYLINGEWKSQ